MASNISLSTIKFDCIWPFPPSKSLFTHHFLLKSNFSLCFSLPSRAYFAETCVSPLSLSIIRISLQTALERWTRPWKPGLLGQKQLWKAKSLVNGRASDNSALCKLPGRRKSILPKCPTSNLRTPVLSWLRAEVQQGAVPVSHRSGAGGTPLCTRACLPPASPGLAKRQRSGSARPKSVPSPASVLEFHPLSLSSRSAAPGLRRLSV